MTRVTKLMLFMFSLFIFSGGCTKSSHVLKKEPGDEVVHKTMTIKPGGSSEECIELRPGMVFDYNFDASDFVNFNIHYHAEDKVKYPVKQQGIMFGKGRIDPGTHDFYTPDQEFYCLMWDNLNEENVKVSFQCVLKDK